jgi:hypothetical protein
MGAAIRPAAVQRAEHPPLVAGEHPHPHVAIPLPMPAGHSPTGSPPCNDPWPPRPKELIKFCLYDTAVRRRLKVAGRRVFVHDLHTPPTSRSRILLDQKAIARPFLRFFGLPLHPHPSVRVDRGGVPYMHINQILRKKSTANRSQQRASWIVRPGTACASGTDTRNRLESRTPPRRPAIRPCANVIVRDHRGQPFYEAKFRLHGRQVKRRIGPAGLDPDPDGGGWRPQRGRVPEGSYDERAATVAAAGIVGAYVSEVADRERIEHERRTRGVTFREVAHAYVAWLKDARLEAVHAARSRPRAISRAARPAPAPGACPPRPQDCQAGRTSPTCRGHRAGRLPPGAIATHDTQPSAMLSVS